ncbi:MAG: hypothetical protein ACYDGO_04075 [Smithellaceae bacterium]
MQIPKDKIELLGKPYFSSDVINKFIDAIERRAPNPEKYFLQVKQKENRPTLEFGCIAGKILLDITTSIENTSIIVIRFSEVGLVITLESNSSTELRITVTATEGIEYVAVGEESRKDLSEYAEYIQNKLVG